MDSPARFALAPRLALALYVALVALLLPRHEPWFDEGQAWLMARDLGLGELFLHKLRYEGTPGLWHLLLAPLAKAGLPYFTLQLVAAAAAVTGAALLALALAAAAADQAARAVLLFPRVPVRDRRAQLLAPAAAALRGGAPAPAQARADRPVRGGALCARQRQPARLAHRGGPLRRARGRARAGLAAARRARACASGSRSGCSRSFRCCSCCSSSSPGISRSRRARSRG
jgi:hypothetical protein